MNAAEIRSLCVETLARADCQTGDWGEQEWDELSPGAQERWRETMAPYVDALAAAGLLPTTALVETCVAGRDGECQCPTTVRYVTDPREVSE